MPAFPWGLAPFCPPEGAKELSNKGGSSGCIRHEHLKPAIASLRIAAAETLRPPHVSFLAAQSPTFRLLLSRAHLGIEPELIVHAEHAERRACDGFSLPALNF
jgi:hypothetical protein